MLLRPNFYRLFHFDGVALGKKMKDTRTAAPTPIVTPSNARGIALRLCGVAAFAAMMALLKFAMAQGASTYDVIFYRNAFALPVILLWIFYLGGLSVVRTRRVGAHAMRGILGLAVMVCTFVALSFLPLAEATAIGFLAPIFATILSSFVLKERVRRDQWAALCVGFVGILLIVQPNGQNFSLLGVLTGLAAAFGTAVVSLLLRSLGQLENAVTTVFWFTAIATCLTAIPFFAWQDFSARDISWPLIAAGLVGGIAQMLITASVRYAPLSMVSPFDYVQILWASCWGYLLFGQGMTGEGIVGAGLIILSGAAAFYFNMRLRSLI